MAHELDINQIRRLAKKGLSRSAIARQLHTRVKRIVAIANANGIELKPAKPQELPIDVDKLRDLAAQGLNATQIAKAMDISKAQVYRRCRMHDIEFKHVAKPYLDQREIRQLAQHGLTVTEVAKLKGYQRCTLILFARRHGIRFIKYYERIRQQKELEAQRKDKEDRLGLNALAQSNAEFARRDELEASRGMYREVDKLDDPVPLSRQIFQDRP